MPAGVTAMGLVVAVLATWRVTHLLQAEDGPWDLVVRLRRAAGDGFWGSLLDCFYCLSLWVAAPFAVLTGSAWLERGMLWLAISGGACLLERLGPNPRATPEGAPAAPAAPAALYFEDEEETDGLLRPEASAGISTQEPFPGASSGAPSAGGPTTPPPDRDGSGPDVPPGGSAGGAA